MSQCCFFVLLDTVGCSPQQAWMVVKKNVTNMQNDAA